MLEILMIDPPPLFLNQRHRVAHPQEHARLIDGDDAVVVLDRYGIDGVIGFDDSRVVDQDRKLALLLLHARHRVPPLIL